MKKIILVFGLLVLVGMIGKLWAGDNYIPGQITNTAVSNSATASSWTLLQGTDQTVIQYDSYGNRYISRAFQISPADGTSDFSYAYTNTPTAYFTWRSAWGPLQNNMNFPGHGIYVCTTPGAGTVTFQCESK